MDECKGHYCVECKRYFEFIAGGVCTEQWECPACWDEPVRLNASQWQYVDDFDGYVKSVREGKFNAE